MLISILLLFLVVLLVLHLLFSIPQLECLWGTLKKSQESWFVLPHNFRVLYCVFVLLFGICFDDRKFFWCHQDTCKHFWRWYQYSKLLVLSIRFISANYWLIKNQVLVWRFEGRRNIETKIAVGRWNQYTIQGKNFFY